MVRIADIIEPASSSAASDHVDTPSARATSTSVSSLTVESSAPLWAAAIVSACIALAAYRSQSLSRSGAIAAFGIGAAALSRSWGWGAFLIIWFALAALLSRLGRSRKAVRTRGVIEKGDRRDFRQVVANGGVFAAAALLSLLHLVSSDGEMTLAIAGAAALTAAGADTWATELGTLGGRRPWSIREWRRVAIGTSGAVTLLGSIASIAGAFLLASIAGALRVVPHAAVVPVAIGGAAGAMVDTMVGAWWQSRRWCPSCSMSTEQPVHVCGTPTIRRGGVGVLDNDGVNLLCTISGALIGVLLGSPN